MTWTKLGDEFTDETWTVSDAAYRLHVDGLVWSNHRAAQLDRVDCGGDCVLEAGRRLAAVIGAAAGRRIVGDPGLAAAGASRRPCGSARQITKCATAINIPTDFGHQAWVVDIQPQTNVPHR